MSYNLWYRTKEGSHEFKFRPEGEKIDSSFSLLKTLEKLPSTYPDVDALIEGTVTHKERWPIAYRSHRLA